MRFVKARSPVRLLTIEFDRYPVLLRHPITIPREVNSVGIYLLPNEKQQFN